ncbi:MAG: serpin family protein [Tannerella sp.]|jgi:serpin B|nr:serpin family protein [Tannerella sp.]
MKNYFFIALALSVMSCSNTITDNDSYENLPDAEPIALTLPEKATSDNRFALDLFLSTCKFAPKTENVFISPLSVSMALSMTLNDARGETAHEMLTSLHQEDYSIDDINEHNRALRNALLKVDPSTELSIANSIWYKTGFPVLYQFIQTNVQNYDAEVKDLDFTKPTAVEQINGWCAQKTKNKIPEIITEIPASAIMYLINAVYFKGIWKMQFKESDTKKETFYLSDNTTVKANMMRLSAIFNFTADDIAGYLELPYGNQAFSMIIALPNADKTIDDITSNLNSHYWNTIIGNLSGCKINLQLPRFKTECKYKMKEEKILPDMGMNIPFGASADFSGICTTQPLNINEVIHKTFVEVNEKGTEAAAVTAVEMDLTSGGQAAPINFTVNKPFIFAIRERSTGVILFIGKIEKVI